MANQKKKEWMKKYNQRPDVKAKKKEYMKEYHQRPEVKAKQKEYVKEYQRRAENKPKREEYQKEYVKEYQRRPKVKSKMGNPNHNYYISHRKKRIDYVKNNQKANNYAPEKTPKARALRSIKRGTRQKYPLKNKKCALCNHKAEERHHTTNPITVADFIFICHRCHTLIHKERGEPCEKTFKREEEDDERKL